MAILSGALAKLCEWLLTIGGKALYESITAFVEKKKVEAINKKNETNYKAALDANDDVARKENMRKLLNGEK